MTDKHQAQQRKRGVSPLRKFAPSGMGQTINCTIKSKCTNSRNISTRISPTKEPEQIQALQQDQMNMYDSNNNN